MLRPLLLIFALASGPALAAPGRDAPFVNIDGGTLSLADWAGQPVLVVNTASQCAFTPQYDALQALWDRHRDAGLVVLAIPSDDFAQELDSAAAVKEFCAMNFALTLPMTDITSVRGRSAHPFFGWVAETAGFTPRWNFNKILIGRDGQVAATFGSGADPLGVQVTQAVRDALARPAP